MQGVRPPETLPPEVAGSPQAQEECAASAVAMTREMAV